MLKNKRKFYIEIIAVFFTLVFTLGNLFTFSVFAEEEITEVIIADPAPLVEVKIPLLIEKDITLESRCEVQDVDGTTHVFPKVDSPSKHLGICALQEALKVGYINDFKLSNDLVLGLYVKSINGIEPSESEFWSLWKNDTFADCGIACLSISEGDTISLTLTNWMTETESDKISLRITTLVSIPADSPDEQEEIQVQEQTEQETSGGNNNGGSHSTTPESFNTEKALNFLKSMQGADGSFANSNLYTDWGALAFAAVEASENSRNSLLGYLSSHNTLSALLTDNERRAMAILALGQNPYSFNGVNYIKAITDTFDGTQFGDNNLVNDDIFALIPLKNSGFSKNDDMITKTITFIISKQNSDGSWFGSVDTTGAAIEALKAFDSIEGARSSIAKASEYLISRQEDNGGWENSIFSTSWAMQAENALNASWKRNGKSGLDFLTAQQKSAGNEGAVLASLETIANRIWATSYAIAAASGKSWIEIMGSVSKPNTQGTEQNNTSPETTQAENNEQQTKNEQVECPAGDLFHTTTGETCTTFIEKTSTLATISEPEMSLSMKTTTKKVQVTPAVNSTEQIATVEKTTPMLTATAIDALPAPDATRNVVLALTTLAIVALLVAGFKAFRA